MIVWSVMSGLVNRLGGVSQVEPSHFPSGRPDLLAFLPSASYIIDLIVGHPASPSHASAPTTPRHLKLAQQLEHNKTLRYLDTPTSSSFLLTPFAIETFGAFGDRALAFLKVLSSTAKDSLPSLPSPPIAYSFYPPSTLQRLHPLPWHRSPSPIFLHFHFCPSTYLVLLFVSVLVDLFCSRL